MTKKTVFIGHPIGGDVEGNMKKVLKICLEVHRIPGVVPVVPYIASLQYLNDEVVEDRMLGMEANHECFYRGYVDELWLFGNRISIGMKGEILLARKVGVPIIAKTEGTKRDLEQLEF